MQENQKDSVIEKLEYDDTQNLEPRTEVLKDIKNSKLNLFDIVTIILGTLSIITCIFWYISIPLGIIGIIFAKKSYQKRNIKKSDYKILLSIMGIVFSLIILFTGIVFSLFEKSYETDDYVIKYGINWILDESFGDTRLLYKKSDDTYIDYIEKEKIQEKLDITNENTRKSLYNQYYNTYRKNSRLGAYYLSSENEEFTKISGFNNTYIAYISYYTSKDEYGRFYIVISNKSNYIFTFRTYANSKYSENILHQNVEKLLRKIRFKNNIYPRE